MAAKQPIKIAQALDIDKHLYKVGATKIFFKAGVLAELEERRDDLLADVFKRFKPLHECTLPDGVYGNSSIALRLSRPSSEMLECTFNCAIGHGGLCMSKVRPLLAATKADDELVKKQTELAMAKEREQRDQEEKKNLEALKASLAAEKAKVENDLNSERQVGRDRDQLLARLKTREADLLEKIAELEADLDVLVRIGTGYGRCGTSSSRNSSDCSWTLTR